MGLVMTRELPKIWQELPDVLGTQDVADVLDVHVNTVKNLIKRGELRAFKVGRVLKVHKIELLRYVGLDDD